MALDEALFRWASETGTAAARFYVWDHAAATFGYFDRRPAGKFPGAVRRITGGGLVEHGEDLTFVLAFPAGSPAAGMGTAERYRWLHEAIRSALADCECRIDLAAGGAAEQTGTRLPGPCFANPVPWDLLDAATGEKLGGGAQRRSRGAVIHQGSLRLPAALRRPDAAWVDAFLDAISKSPLPLANEAKARMLECAARLEAERYSTREWNDGTSGNR